MVILRSEKNNAKIRWRWTQMLEITEFQQKTNYWCESGMYAKNLKRFKLSENTKKILKLL